ncbi:MAG: hypothetical protein M1827_007171 [Pycnora praestabilis]|nr:MAG: hypothetical protein M1827_007171 [Pycnora praestabilis]
MVITKSHANVKTEAPELGHGSDRRAMGAQFENEEEERRSSLNDTGVSLAGDSTAQSLGDFDATPQDSTSQSNHGEDLPRTTDQVEISGSIYETPVFTIVSSSSKHHTFTAHQGVLEKSPLLASRCQYQLDNNLSPILDLSPIGPERLRLLLKYLYTGEYPASTPASVCGGDDITQVDLLQGWTQVYCLGRTFQLEDVSMCARTMIEDRTRHVQFQDVLSLAVEAYPQLPDSERWFYDYFRTAAKRALAANNSMREEPWVLDFFRKGVAGQLPVDLYSILVAKGEGCPWNCEACAVHEKLPCEMNTPNGDEDFSSKHDSILTGTHQDRRWETPTWKIDEPVVPPTHIAKQCPSPEESLSPEKTPVVEMAPTSERPILPPIGYAPAGGQIPGLSLSETSDGAPTTAMDDGWGSWATSPKKHKKQRTRVETAKKGLTPNGAIAAVEPTELIAMEQVDTEADPLRLIKGSSASQSEEHLDDFWDNWSNRYASKRELQTCRKAHITGTLASQLPRIEDASVFAERQEQREAAVNEGDDWFPSIQKEKERERKEQEVAQHSFDSVGEAAVPSGTHIEDVAEHSEVPEEVGLSCDSWGAVLEAPAPAPAPLPPLADEEAILAKPMSQEDTPTDGCGSWIHASQTQKKGQKGKRGKKPSKKSIAGNWYCEEPAETPKDESESVIQYTVPAEEEPLVEICSPTPLPMDDEKLIPIDPPVEEEPPMAEWESWNMPKNPKEERIKPSWLVEPLDDDGVQCDIEPDEPAAVFNREPSPKLDIRVVDQIEHAQPQMESAPPIPSPLAVEERYLANEEYSYPKINHFDICPLRSKHLAKEKRWRHCTKCRTELHQVALSLLNSHAVEVAEHANSMTEED